MQKAVHRFVLVFPQSVLSLGQKGVLCEFHVNAGVSIFPKNCFFSKTEYSSFMFFIGMQMHFLLKE